MKKIIFVFLILSFVIIGATTPITTNVFKEGIYNLSDFEALLTDKIYEVQNVSTNKSSLVIVLDNNLTTLQSIKLNPKSIKYDLTPLKSNYKIIVLGDGDVYIS
ncbi:hypothetical protein [Clostridium saccharoperbutylacetonicum]|uniref:hypothetical protein n=1 Tax=Clostridium saccharoperbutylacetonicum TaxID=36745 RepID=UPI0039E9D7DC